MQLGKLGVWSFLDALAAPEAARFARRVEELGYAALWIPEAVGREALSAASWLLAGTNRLVVATGIANIYARDPITMAAGAKTLAEQSGGRFLLGIGVSHKPLVEGVRGHDASRPLEAMRQYLDRMQAAPYTAVAPKEDPPIVIGALHPRMLALAAERTQGAHPYLVPPEHTAFAREQMGPDAWLCVEQKVLLETDAAKARSVARQAIAMYLGLPNYRRNLRRFGYGDEDLDGGGSDRLVDAVVAWGSEEAIASRIKAHFDAGATHVCIQPLHPEGLPVPDEKVLECFAPARGSSLS
ncbi:MAG: TIGR03620 family F420-dependent LLM class oxidoreductase [Candidatus Dadabacteria bacterium]|nr:MAG: TIGR03620 family F420-dependent LLM class oxidoreductase [Candidatus Dadabacteria bacterium]